MSFNGKVAIITGSSSGIGAETALKFAELGANVVITGRDATKLVTIGNKCRQISGNESKILEINADLTKEVETENLIKKTVETFGGIDILVNNAAIIVYHEVNDQNLMQIYDQTMNSNVRAVLSVTSLALPYIERSKGVIVNISSVASLIPVQSMMTYCTSKAALDMFTKCLALELAPKGIRVNSIQPGVTRTPMLNNGTRTIEAYEKHCLENYPLRRMGEPEDVVNAIVFLASDQSKSITGAALPVDGGCLMDSPVGKS